MKFISRRFDTYAHTHRSDLMDVLGKTAALNSRHRSVIGYAGPCGFQFSPLGLTPVSPHALTS